MQQETISIYDSELGLRCSMLIEAVSPRVIFTLKVEEKAGFCTSRYEGTFSFPRESLLRALMRLGRRIEGAGAHKSLSDVRWASRPLKFMRRDGLFLGSLRGHAHGRPMRWRLALVPRMQGRLALEISIDDLELSSVQLPPRSIRALRHALERIISCSELKPEEESRASRLYSLALSEFLDNGAVQQTCCNQCDGPIQVDAMGRGSYRFHCPCGKYRGTR